MTAVREIEELEISLLLEAIYQRFGNDFRNHQTHTLREKLHCFMSAHSIVSISMLQGKILHDANFIELLLCALNTRPVALFNHPEQMLKLRRAIVPWLRSCPAPKIWIADCIAAEDVYGLAIVLMEENLYYKTRIYVTGANASLLANAQQSRFPAKLLKQYEQNYLLAGGANALLNYCEKIAGSFLFIPALQQNITWAEYNLETDASFNEFEVIVCCSGLSDLNWRSRHRALQIFYESQPNFGMLNIAGENPLEITSLVSRYKAISKKYGLYQRMVDDPDPLHERTSGY